MANYVLSTGGGPRQCRRRGRQHEDAPSQWYLKSRCPTTDRPNATVELGGPGTSSPGPRSAGGAERSRCYRQFLTAGS